ncbi:MAG: biotin--[acetyl-CoA-carboxylase] ligase [Egibacteraceae bacterium]
MEVAAGGDDLAVAALRAALPDREMRSYPAALSTHAHALAWARAGADEGSVVVADYQASPRGRAGLVWQVRPGEGLGFSLVLRPGLPVEREGWLYTVAVSGIADVASDGAAVTWPDEVHAGPGRVGAVGVHAELGPRGVDWAVVTVLLDQALPPRAPLLASVVAAVERRGAEQPDALLTDYRARCQTLGRHVRARMIPLGPSGPQVEGQAVDCLADGALLIAAASGARVAVLPHHLGVLEEL